MARIRTIKPEFWGDYQLAQQFTRDQRLFYIALWNEADDEGRFQAHPVRLKGVVFPYDDDIHGAFIEDSLKALAEAGKLVLYQVNGEPYAQLTNFKAHQRINRPSQSRIPKPPKDLPDPHGVFTEDSRNTHGGLTEPSSTEREGKGKGKEPPIGPPLEKTRRSPERALPRDWMPNVTHADLATAEGVDLSREADRFRDHARANDRKQRDWDAAFRNWLRKAGEINGNSGGNPSNTPGLDPYVSW